MTFLNTLVHHFIFYFLFVLLLFPYFVEAKSVSIDNFQLQPITPDEQSKIRDGCSCEFQISDNIVCLFDYQNTSWIKVENKLRSLKKQGSNVKNFISPQEKLIFKDEALSLEIQFGSQNKSGDEVWKFENTVMIFKNAKKQFKFIAEAQCGC